MSVPTELLVLAFAEESTALKALQALQRLVDEGRISLRNAAVLVKNKEGRISAKEMGDVSLKQGALFGAIVGGLIGLVGGPVGAVVGAVAGATTGGVAAHAIDFGFPDDYLSDLQASLQPGTSALIVLAEKNWIDKIIQGLTRFNGHIIRHVLKEELAAHLAAVGTVVSDTSPAAQLEEQLAAWQAEIERLKLQETTRGGKGHKEARNQIVNLRTKLRRTQEKLHALWKTEIQVCTDKITTLQVKAETAPAATQAEILAELEATRTYRREIRDKLYRQIEVNLTGLQAEIEDLKARELQMRPASTGPVDSRTVALKRFVGPMEEPTLPPGETEAAERIAILQTRVAAAETELETLRELQIAAWQEAIKDLQAYAAIPGVVDKAAVAARIPVLEDQLVAAKATLKVQLENQVAGWSTEINQLQTELATVGAAERAKANEQIAALRTQIEMLQIKAETAGAAERINLNTRMLVLQDKVAKAQAKLQALD
ncbi:MAG: DUF1269 domain-containing protein [Anaerolineales bacterium]|nr:DUF1269 domain-containing protein [Anaerolineales bacterium]